MSPTVPLLRRPDDPETSSDPRVRAIVTRLGELELAPAPRPEFRDELRAQLVAIAARVVDESTATATNPGDTARHRRAVEGAERHRRRFVRPLGIATACVAVLALALGGVVWKSQDALPGDSLYGLKRASEDVQLSLTHGDTDRGHQYLRLAATRAHEAKDLLGHDSALGAGSGVLAAGVSSSTAALISSTLQSSNSDLANGSRLLTTEATRSASMKSLDIITTWAPKQLHLLKGLASSVDDETVRQDALHSWSLVRKAQLRAAGLRSAVRHGCSASSVTPCTGSTSTSATPSTAVPSTPRHTSAAPSSHPSSATRHHSDGTTVTPPSTSPSGGPTSTPHGGSTSSPNPNPITLSPPSLPVTLLPTHTHSGHTHHAPSQPISVGSCGVSASLGPIGIGIGGCKSGD